MQPNRESDEPVDLTSADFVTLKARLLDNKLSAHANKQQDGTSLNTHSEQPQVLSTPSAAQNDLPTHPTLRKTMSEPVAQPTAMADQTPFNLARSFADTGGDTQLNDSQLYNQYRTADTPAQEPSAVEETPFHRSEDEDTQYEYGLDSMGAKNSLNLAGDMLSQQSPIQEDVSESHIDMVPTSPETQFLHDRQPFPGLLATPQLAGHKRSSDGQVISSATRDGQTPALAAAFGGLESPAVGATQLFNQTQAPSSPPPDGTRSDPIMTRPSPNMEEFVPFRSDFGTSPVMMRQSMPSSTAAQELRQYTTVDESQEQRRILQALGKYRVVDAGMDIGDEVASRSQLLRARSEQAMRAVESVTAPSRAVSATPQITVKHRRKAGRPDKEQEHEIVDLIEDDLEANKDAGDNQAMIELVEEEQETEDEEDADPDAVRIGQEQEAIRHEDEVIEIGDIAEPTEINTGDDEYDELSSAVRNTQPDPNEVNRPIPVIQNEIEILEINPDERIANSAEVVGSNRTSNVNPSSKPTVIPGSQDVVEASQNSEGSEESSQRIQGTSDLAEHDRETMASSPPNLPELPSRPCREESDTTHEISAPAAQEMTGSQRFSKGIPDSEAYGSSPAVQRDSSKDSRPVDDSLSTRIFSTARSHLSPTKLNGQSLRSGNIPTQDSVATPLKNAGAKSHYDIIRTMQPEESVDFDEIMGDVYTEEDREHQIALASPTARVTRKKRKLSHPTTNPASQKNRQAKQVLAFEDINQSQPAKEPQNMTTTVAANEDVVMVDREQHLSPHALATPLSEAQVEGNTEPDQQHTTDSTRQQEETGSAAVSELVAFRHTAVSPSTKLSGPGRRTYGRKDRKLPKKSAVTKEAGQHKPAAQSTHSRKQPAPELVDQTDVDPAIRKAFTEDSSAVPSKAVKAPKRVLALAKGKYQAYYPATVTGKFFKDDQNVAVEYDDGSTLTIGATEALHLHLEVGDIVQIKFPNTKECNWIIRAFGPVKSGDLSSTFVDIYGHETIKVEAKSAKGKSKLGSTSQSDLREAKISDIFVRRAQSTIIGARMTNPPLFQDQLKPPSDTATIKFASTPTTPGLQSGRRSRMVNDAKHSSPHMFELKQQSRAGGIAFSNMAFAVSFDNDNDTAKKETLRQIEENGGKILEHGFDELFVSSALYDEHIGNKKNFTPGLQIKPEYASIGFVALIGDRHSRRPKYLQALALGLPTLSYRWIADTLSSTHPHDQESSLDWSSYLLPAGHSAYLNAIRSRTLQNYTASNAELATTIATRNIPFNGDKLLSVAKKSKQSDAREKRRIYSFLTLAMGASGVKWVTDLSEAMAMVKKDSDWRWIHVDGNVHPTYKATFLGVKQKQETHGKRKRGGDVVNEASDLLVRKDDMALIGDEFVVQSLILGALIR